MKQILLFGAGKSSSFLIKYLIANAVENNYNITIVDQNTQHLQDKYGDESFLKLLNIDVFNNEEREGLIKNATLVISLLPPNLHIIVAKDCLQYSKPLITASYVSNEIKLMDEELQKKGVLFMCEMGLDPGIDHMSAMKIIHEIENKGGEIMEFKSHCGGLILPESDTNPWHYKISWNSRNVVTAGNAGAHYLLNNIESHLDYANIFKDCKTITLKDIGTLAYYPNRDSLNYKNLYNLKNINTLMRTTLRYPSYTNAWNYLVQMNLTSEKIWENIPEKFTFNNWLQQQLQTNDVEAYLKNIFKNDDVARQLFDYLEIQNNELIDTNKCKSNADILQFVIEDKWKMLDTDKDMIVMQHEFHYKQNLKEKYLKSTLVVKGENKTYTAMAKTVGLPMAILAKLIITNKISGLSGVHIPVMPQVYLPVLDELNTLGISFDDEEN